MQLNKVELPRIIILGYNSNLKGTISRYGIVHLTKIPDCNPTSHPPLARLVSCVQLKEGFF
jgi:hypothetical protein